MKIVIDAIYQGILLGLILCILIGPSFFALIQTSLKNGVKSGIALAIGIFFSDLVCVALAYLGASNLFQNPNNKIYIGLIGGTVLIVFGIINLQKKAMISETDITVKKNISFSLTIVKGFMLNILNPFVLLLWISYVATVSAKENFQNFHVIIFFCFALSTVLITDILKAIAADNIKKYLKPNLLVWLNRVVGILMMGFGLHLIYRIFSGE